MSQSTQTVQAIRGMNDILPIVTPSWQHLESILREVVNAYGYQEIRFPIVEKTELFKRSIGEVTDIVEKEMYTFTDRNGDNLTLRPEGTAVCVRAGIEHGLLYNQIQRLWYMGPMFRHERPQKGRYRQFHQFGAEVFGINGAAIEAEIILLTARLWQQLGLEQQVSLHINSLGSAADRATYREHLVNYFSNYQEQLDENSRRRLLTNPLRILDSKNPIMQSLIAEAPKLADFLNDRCKAEFAELCSILDIAGIAYTVNPRLVRGLDYYNNTVFEWIMQEAGSQNTVCAGGRYDSLVEQLGGKATAAVGFALGLERLLQLIEAEQADIRRHPDAYFIMVGEVQQQGMLIAETLRDKVPGLQLLVDCTGGSFKNQMKRADKSEAQFALILGDNELTANKITLKYLREEKAQSTFSIDELINVLLEILK